MAPVSDNSAPGSQSEASSEESSGSLWYSPTNLHLLVASPVVWLGSAWLIHGGAAGLGTFERLATALGYGLAVAFFYAMIGIIPLFVVSMLVAYTFGGFDDSPDAEAAGGVSWGLAIPGIVTVIATCAATLYYVTTMLPDIENRLGG